MKKNLQILLLLLISIATAKAQNPIPNYSFEEWTNGSPDGWFTSNSIFGQFITQVSPGHTGSSAAKGEVLSLLGYNFPPQLYSLDTSTFQGFPVNQVYSDLYFFYKFNQIGTANILVAIDFLDALDSVVAGGASFIPTPATSFTLGTVPIIMIGGGTPVTCIITITILDPNGNLPALGNYFIIDDLSFDNPIGVPSVADANYFLDSPIPNPSSMFTTISYSLPKPADVDLKIYDLLGREVKMIHDANATSGENLLNVDVADLSDGTYILSLNSEFGMLQRRIVVSK